MKHNIIIETVDLCEEDIVDSMINAILREQGVLIESWEIRNDTEDDFINVSGK